MEIIKKEFSCRTTLVGSEKDAVPIIVLELGSGYTVTDKGLVPYDDGAFFCFQPKGAREVAAALLREADALDAYLKSIPSDGVA